MNVEPGGSASVLSLRLDPDAGPQIARLELYDGLENIVGDRPWTRADALQLELVEELGRLDRALELASESQSLNFLHVPLADLGLAPPSSRYEVQDPARVSPPVSAIDAIASVVSSHVGPKRPLYLRFGRPSGGLPMLPWERWLSEPLGAPIVRWPYLPVPSAPAGAPLQIAICGSVPRSSQDFRLADLVRSSVRQLGETGARVRFHVYVDAERERALRSHLGADADREEIEVVPAGGADHSAVPRRARDQDEEEPARVENPWLRWILKTAPPRLDMVLFLCHGYLANGRGSLTFAETPVANRDSRAACFAGRRQVVNFLDACGARALALSSPPLNSSISGLLALADEVARHRPGPVVFHDFEADPGGEALGGALSTVLLARNGPRAFPQSPAIATYVSVDLLDDDALADPSARAASARAARILTVGEPSPPAAAAASSQTTVPTPAAPPQRQLRGGPIPRVADTGRESAPAVSSQDPGSADPSPDGSSDKDLESARSAETETSATALTEGAAAAPAATVDPRWKAASQRVFERHAATLATQDEAQTSYGRAAQEGREKALKFVADILSVRQE